MIKMDATYSDWFKPADAEYPYGSAIDASTEDSNDGTPYMARWRNDVIGMMQAIFVRAFGNSRQPTNSPDNALHSDVADAIERLIENAFNNQCFQVEVEGEETIIEWSVFNKEFDQESKYQIVALPDGDYQEFLPCVAFARQDGIHIIPRRLINGKIIKGTRGIKWGSFVFGERKFGESGTMRINILIKELKQ